MKQFLRLNLLGMPQIMVGERQMSGFATNKAQALLFYLAVTAQTNATHPVFHSRDAVATLLWGEMTDKKAKQNLRTVLSDLRRLVGDHLLIDRQTIAFDPTSPYWLDVEILQRDLMLKSSPENLSARQTAVSLYKGEFLSGFSVHNAPEFENWMLEQRQKLHILVVQALFTLVNEQIECGDFAAGLAANHQLLGLEPWSEPVHRQQMLLLARLGERSAALAQFETCQQILAEEFGVEPLPETFALYDQIRAGKIVGRRDKAPTKPVTHPPTAVINERNFPQRTDLFGRQKELESLRKWLLQDGCRLVGIFGMGGLGKSTLAAALARTLATPDAAAPGENFQHIIWNSLLNAPPLVELIQEWIYDLSDQTVTSLPEDPDQQVKLLLEYLQRRRCLLILDNLESILQSEHRNDAFLPGYEAYGRFLRHLADANHQSCILMTSRERPYNLTGLEEENATVRFLSLSGLPPEAGSQMLAARGLTGTTTRIDDLVRQYSGNPLALKLAADTVQEIFKGSVTGFLRAEAVVFDDIRYVLDQQFARLSPTERELMVWLTVVREPISYNELRALLAQQPLPHTTLEAMRSLLRRSLVEMYEGGFGLQNVILEYCTDLLVANVVRELLAVQDSELNADDLKYLNCFALVLAQTKEYVRASQTRLLLAPVAQQLTTQLGVRRAEQVIKMVLAFLRSEPTVPGYAAANLLHLLLHLKIDLRGYDFSKLYFRQLYLRGESLPQANFSGAEIIDSVFTEPFGLVYSVAFSPDGRLLAAGMGEGAIYVWQTGEQQLVHVLQGHDQAVDAIAFGQITTMLGDTQLLLASAGNDGRIGVYSLAEREVDQWRIFLTHPQHRKLMAVHVNGRLVIGVNTDGHVFVWNIADEKNPVLAHQFNTAATRFGLVAFSADGHILVVGRRNGSVQFHNAHTGEQLRFLDTGMDAMASLALRQDGQMLAVGDKSGQIGLWQIAEDGIHQITQQFAKMSTAAVDALAFNQNGRQLASTHGVGDQTVRLWSVDTQKGLNLLHTLPGHTLIIWAVCFSPIATLGLDNGVSSQPLLATGSSDQTVRVWDLTTGQTLYTQKGQQRALSAFAIQKLPEMPSEAVSETGQWLLSAAGYDHLVHLWQGDGVQTMVQDHVLSRAKMALYAVAISPDGRFLASGGHSGIVYLWERTTGKLLQTFRGHSKAIYYVGFHPNGELLVSSSPDGTVRLWPINQDQQQNCQPMAVIPGHPNILYDAALRADGRFLATVGTDLHLRLWDLTQENYPEQMELRKTVSEPGEQDMVSVVFSPDGTKVAAGGSSVIHVWDVCSSEPVHILRQHSASIFGLAFSLDGQLLVSGGADCTICIWQVSSGKMQQTIQGHEDTIYEVDFTPDGAFVLSCSFDGTIKFWDVQTGECVNTLMIEGPYAGMNISDMMGVTEAQKAALQALGAVGT